MGSFGILRGRFSIGETAAMIVKPPFIRPDPPIPAIARPMMSIVELVATPHMREPISNMNRKIRNVIYYGLDIGLLFEDCEYAKDLPLESDADTAFQC